MSQNDTKKNIVISCGPIPARLDSVKFITNRFKGGLAFKTANYLANHDNNVTVIVWKFTEIPENIAQNPNIREIVRVTDVFEYYDWFVTHAKDYDAFVMAAAVANLTPVKPYEGKFPSHNYKPGDEFDIKFMIAPRAIDAIKAVNPRACLIGYKLFDEPDDAKLIDIARHTLADARANLIFANRPSEAKTRKIAVTADNSAFECDFDQHLQLINMAIHQEYFKTEVQPLTNEEREDNEILAAMELVAQFEKTLDKYGTIAIPIKNGRQFVTTSRGHKGFPVLVRSVDEETRTIRASAKATLNAPAMGAFVKANQYAVHRHFDDPKANKTSLKATLELDNYVFPGTIRELEYAKTAAEHGFDRLEEPHHGYIQTIEFQPVNWPEYHATFPEKYFGVPEAFTYNINRFNEAPGDTLEIGGNTNPEADYSYDPYVTPENGAVSLTIHQIPNMHFSFAFARNAICYLTLDELRTILSRCDHFMANAPAIMPDYKTSDREVAFKTRIYHSPGIKTDDYHDEIRHFLMLDDDRIVKHSFFAYEKADYERLGLTVTTYGRNSALITKNIEV